MRDVQTGYCGVACAQQCTLVKLWNPMCIRSRGYLACCMLVRVRRYGIMSPSDLTLLALIVANTVGVLYEPVVILGVLAATVTLLVLLGGLAVERRELSGLAARGPSLQVRPARPRPRLQTRLGHSGA
jgi:hypothetical protein